MGILKKLFGKNEESEVVDESRAEVTPQEPASTETIPPFEPEEQAFQFTNLPVRIIHDKTDTQDDRYTITFGDNNTVLPEVVHDQMWSELQSAYNKKGCLVDNDSTENSFTYIFKKDFTPLPDYPLEHQPNFDGIKEVISKVQRRVRDIPTYVGRCQKRDIATENRERREAQAQYDREVESMIARPMRMATEASEEIIKRLTDAGMISGGTEQVDPIKQAYLADLKAELVTEAKEILGDREEVQKAWTNQLRDSDSELSRKLFPDRRDDKGREL